LDLNKNLKYMDLSSSKYGNPIIQRISNEKLKTLDIPQERVKKENTK
jgi:hypothetical protein